MQSAKFGVGCIAFCNCTIMAAACCGRDPWVRWTVDLCDSIEGMLFGGEVGDGARAVDAPVPVGAAASSIEARQPHRGGAAWRYLTRLLAHQVCEATAC